MQTRRDLADALLSVLASEDSRREFLRGGLGRSYDAMVPSGADPRASVQAVIETAAREGWLDELVTRDWELVGLSTAARTKSEVRGAANVGVLLLAVLGDLRDHGFGHLLGTAFL